MPAIDPAKQREFAVQAVHRLRQAGFQALWAGGCVRDHLLGRTPKDYDVATDATPDQVRQLFGRRRTLPVGAAFGVIAVIGPAGTGQIEVVTFRRDGVYLDGRHPHDVAFSGIEDDARRRDFTINGMYFDPVEERVIDLVGGHDDLRRGLVRAIGDPSIRFGEDKLRMLRAVRFVAAYGFQLDEGTLNAIRSMAAEIAIVSPERIAQEMRVLLVLPTRAQAVQLLHASGLLTSLLPELAHGADQEGEGQSGWLLSLDVLGRLVAPSFALALAALLLRGRPEGLAPLPDHPVHAASLVHDVADRWRLSRDERERAAWLAAHQGSFLRAPTTPWPRLQRLLVSPLAAELLALDAAVSQATGEGVAAVAVCREHLARPAEDLNPPPLLSGKDLLRLGLRPGPEFRRILEAVRDAQLEGRVRGADEALALAVRLKGGTGGK
jgi:tRNA nucleotidyltransferase/poly(A) polymerase